ncbi:helicase ARIP4 isoform X2 [Calliphora vicina]|uniref:helicase ARIP4 isoform X2 n=1 Tax=Calliphora vicina TaxID=7373 RepID=UPI00325A8491
MDNTDKINYMVNNPVDNPMAEALKQQDAFNQHLTNIHQFPSDDPLNNELTNVQKMSSNNGSMFVSCDAPIATTTTSTGTLDCPKATSSPTSSLLKHEMPADVEIPPVYPNDMCESQKRKSPVEPNVDVSHLAKKQQLCQLAEEKKKSSLRKNIREVMDTNQLDTNTLRAQHEESERLARVAEQQKLLREYQQREAVLTHFDRFVNEHRVRDPADLIPEQKKANLHKVPEENDVKVEQTATCQSFESTETETDTEPVKSAEDKEDAVPAEVVTIEDSSDDDDCIVLSDDEAELEEDNENDDPHNSGMHVKDEFNVPDHLGRVVINVGHPEDEEDIFIAPQIARTIKPHQIGGVRFLFDNIIESIKRFKSSGGFGCILAHSMGLGKTLQVVCFSDIFLRYTPSKHVVCVMPINTLQNWLAEFDMWIPKQSDNPEYIRPRHFDVFVLNDQQKTLTARAKVILQWKERGGVLLIGYELYRLLALKLSTAGKRRSKKCQTANDNFTESRSRVMDEVYEALVKPGPDLIICDEGHRIKNAQAGISQALKQIGTRRRIVLTGYPLQNNLLEYWCMVDFVRPNYLGTRTEFCNMFERPIQNGLCIDSTPDDIKLMRYRAHVLHSLLVGFVQRRSHTVLQLSLPEKQEFVILTRMSELQKQLYDTFMNDIVRTKNVPNPLKAFAVCCKIWNHPDVLYDAMKMADSGLDWDIEEVDDIPIASSVNKNGFPPPVPATTACLPLNTDTPLTPSETQTYQPILKSSIHDSETSTPLSVQQLQNQNDLKDTSQAIAQTLSASATKTNNYQGPSLFSEMNQFENPTLNTVPYNPDMQSSYFSYPTMMSSMGRPLQPNYVGCMLKQTAHETSNADDSHNSSSEIVDLDTNEIRTIETDIDMDKNIPLNKDDKSDKPNASIDNDKSETDSHFSSSIGASENNDVEQKKGSEKITYDWAMKFMKKYEPGLISNSPKMEIFFCILNESVCIGDRVLLFSQSLLTLNLIEKLLQANRIPGEDTNWTYNKHYFRLDGSTTSQEREKFVNEFNSNTNVKLFLISTKAGSLGINLVGANRVIIFDASWNPCHDTQAIYRIYRYGQRRACFIYRLVMDRCLEKKIYDRQIKKQGMSDRVVDECNPDAHLSIKDVTNLCYDYDDDDDKTNTFEYIKPLDTYTDTIMKIILTEYKTCLTKEPFFHESLLIDRKGEKLSQAEKRLAHRSYEMQKKTSAKQTVYSNSNRIQYQTVRKDGSLITRPVASAPRSQTTQKNSSGLRTTRWIPAEVWQKQGMTAQEMSLPLDVVIPTNSSNKSKIIIKAGQRVMVLKSAKGIYMQLDSGKIIAIRTLNKPNVATTEKSDVIDITGESETASSKESPKTEKSETDNASSPANKDADLKLNNGNGNQNDEAPKEASNQLNLFNSSTNVDTNVFNNNNTSIESENKSKSNLMIRANNDTQEQSTSLHFSQRQQTQIQQQPAQPVQSQSQPQQQQQNSHVSHTQTLNEQQHLQSNPPQIPTQTPTISQTQLMHSQQPTAYSQHQTYAYTQHPTLRNSAAHYTAVRAGDINTYNSYPQTPQYTDYPSYGSQPQSTRYHPTSSNSSHTNIAPVVHPPPPPPPPTNPQTAAASHPPSLSDFYGSYYPQWSTFMLTAPTQTSNDNPHLMHSTYPPLAAQPHSHSHHAKVQSNSHPWPQYHP